MLVNFCFAMLAHLMHSFGLFFPVLDDLILLSLLLHFIKFLLKLLASLSPPLHLNVKSTCVFIYICTYIYNNIFLGMADVAYTTN